MALKDKFFYITTTLPYVNADPHIGFALEIIQADVIARYKRLQGFNVFFNTGTDEHGQKIYLAAKKEGIDTQKYVDIKADKFDSLKEALNLSYNNFIRTTQKHHIKAAQEFWKRCEENGDIYKRNYKIKYCVGCELEKTNSELVNGRCPFHPNLKLEIIEEENYFFRFSKYQKKLLKLYEKEDFVVPNKRMKEIKNFVKAGLRDFSISRLKEKMPWGVPVPGDKKHVMYVWFDALTNYISAIGWPDDLEKFNKYWPAVQLAGKDNLRQQSAMWQAMLMSCRLEPSKQIIIHGFITNEGQKMSKSLGNIVDPIKLSKKYGSDALRFYLLKYFHPFEDGDFSIYSFKELYNVDLVNNLGNLTSRLANLFEKSGLKKIDKLKNQELINKITKSWSAYESYFDGYKFNKVMTEIFDLVSLANRFIDENKPWKFLKDSKNSKLKEILSDGIFLLFNISWMLKPFLPKTSDKIFEIFGLKKDSKKEWHKEFIKIKKDKILFPRLKN